MAIDFQSLLAKLRDGSVPSSSTFNLFNEDNQKRSGGVGINRYKYTFKQKARLLFPLQLAIPFNPETGKADDNFNPGNKWRPAFSATDAAIVVKAYASMNEGAKEAFMRRVGVTEWDTSDLGTLTALDKKILRQYRVPTVASAYVISVTDPKISGNEFPVNYYVDVKIDQATGDIVSELPQLAKFGEVYRDLVFAEINEIKQAREQKNASLYRGDRPFINRSSIPSMTKKIMEDMFQKLWQSVPIGTIRPSNYLLGFMFDLNPKTASMVGDDKQQLESFASDISKIEEHRIYVSYSKKFENYITTTIKEEVNDVFFDFIEADMIDQQAKEPTDDISKMQAARDITPTRPASSLWNSDEDKFRLDWNEAFVEGVGKCISEAQDFEKKVKRLIAKTTNKLTDEVTEAARGVIKSTLPLSHVYLTDSLCLRHRDTFLYVYGSVYNKEMIKRGLIDDEESTTAKEAIVITEEALESKKAADEAANDMDLEMDTVNME